MKKFLLILLLISSPLFAQTAEKSESATDMSADAFEFLLFQSATVKTSDYPYEYSERNYYFNKDTNDYNLCKYLALETNISFLVYLFH